jgi:hypothetical protein
VNLDLDQPILGRPKFHKIVTAFGLVWQIAPADAAVPVA